MSATEAIAKAWSNVVKNAVDKIETAAKATHEVNRAYCMAIGDNSQVSWEDAPEWQRESARRGVEAIISNPEITSEESHNNWLEEKRANGWAWGSTKNPEMKLHPCMLPYADLPASQRAKDALFGATVRGVLAHLSED